MSDETVIQSTDPTRVAAPASETMEMRQKVQAESLLVDETLPDTTPPHKLGDVAEWTGKEIALRYADALNKGALARDFSDAVALFAPHTQLINEFEQAFERFLDPEQIRAYMERIPRTARFTPISGVVIEDKAVVRARFRVDGLFHEPKEGIWTITTDGYDRIVAVRVTTALTDSTDPHVIPSVPFELPDHLLRQAPEATDREAGDPKIFELG